MINLTEDQIKNIMDNGLIDQCTDDEKKQVFCFAFGTTFMRSKDKGTKKVYAEIQNLSK